MLKKINFHIDGMHCKSCKTLIETEVDELPGVTKTNVNHLSGEAWVEFEEDKISKDKIFKAIKKLNYHPKEYLNELDRNRVPNKKKETSKSQFILGLLIPLSIFGLIALYMVAQNMGGFELMSRLNEGSLGYGIIFFIGILAGFHCVGMCGGLVVAYSASCLKYEDKQSFLPHLQYNLARMASYTVIGGILGGVGSFFAINPTFTGAVILVAGTFMILMGLSFIYNWAILDKIKLRTPAFIAKYLYSQKHSKKPKGPLAIGLLNGLMPCGPLQAMQLYALTSGSVTEGALSMAVYALGTIPIMFGFGAFVSTIGQKYIKKIVKFSGALIIILGILMANRGLANFGYGINIGFQNNTSSKEFKVSGDIEEFQTVRMDVTYFGYKPNVLYIKKDIPVRWIINGDEITGCTNAIEISSLGIKKNLVKGENIIEFTPTELGEIKFSCWMKMVWGKFIVTEDDYNPTGLELDSAAADLSASGSCGGGSGGCGCGGGTISAN